MSDRSAQTFHFDITSPKQGSEVAKQRDEWGLSQRAFARMLGVTERSLANYKKKDRPLSGTTLRRLNEMGRLRAAIAEIIPPSSLKNWLQSPNPAFDNLSPIELIERGEMDRLWEMVFLIRSGLPG
jgi:transcriptional regulator with XRE-family HTH domain